MIRTSMTYRTSIVSRRASMARWKRRHPGKEYSREYGYSIGVPYSNYLEDKRLKDRANFG